MTARYALYLAPAEDSALNKVDLPTLGNPTIPHLSDICYTPTSN